jgi:hypothetical protein
MRKRQRCRESEKIISSLVIIHSLHVPLSHGKSVITSPAAQGVALAINSTLETEGGNHQALLSYEATK